MRRLMTWILVAALLSPSLGWACGGCFNPPGPSLVVQDAERVLFMRDDTTGKTRVWVEVRYSGPAEDFGWVVPLPAIPTVGVGSSYVFDRLDQAAAPRFVTSLTNKDENCFFPNMSDSIGCGADMAMDSGATAFANSAEAGGGLGPDERAVTVVAKAQVGPYDYEVVKSTSGDKLYKWLNDNGYATPEASKPVIEDHVKKGDVFVAFKLQNNAGVNDIRPVTFEMTDADPCVPLRLTSIAANDNMAIVVYLLGEGRAVPKNNFHVVVNETKLRWEGGVNNYEQVMAQAIDEAAGHAFVTEFAGPSSKVEVLAPETAFRTDVTALYGVQIDAETNFGPPVAEDSIWTTGALFDAKYRDVSAFKSVKTSAEVVTALRASKLAVVGEVASDLEAATGLAAANGQAETVLAFWTGVRSGASYKDTAKQVDGDALHKALKEGFAAPLDRVAKALAESKNTLTRLNLRIDPSEMDRDPIFGFHAKLPNVPNVHRAELTRVCPGGDSFMRDMRVSLASGSWIIRGSTATNLFAQQNVTTTSTNLNVDPRFEPGPFAAVIEVLDETGDPIGVPKAQIDLLDSALKGAELGKPSLSPDLVLSGELAKWSAPASDPHASVLSAAGKVHATDLDALGSGCTQGAPARRGQFSVLALLLCALGAIGVRRIRG